MKIKKLKHRECYTNFEAPCQNSHSKTPNKTHSNKSSFEIRKKSRQQNIFWNQIFVCSKKTNFSFVAFLSLTNSFQTNKLLPFLGQHIPPFVGFLVSSFLLRIHHWHSRLRIPQTSKCQTFLPNNVYCLFGQRMLLVFVNWSVPCGASVWFRVSARLLWRHLISFCCVFVSHTTDKDLLLFALSKLDSILGDFGRNLQRVGGRKCRGELVVVRVLLKWKFLEIWVRKMDFELKFFLVFC